MYYSRWSFPTYPYTNGSSRSRRSQLSKNYAVTAMAGRDKKVTAATKDSVQVVEVPQIDANEFGPIGKVVFGVTQIAVTCIMEGCTGFLIGLVAGTLVGTPGLLFRPLEPGVPKVFMTEVKGRLSRMNTRSINWGKSWGGINAVFGGCGVTIRVIRGDKQDAWNNIFSTAAAGAFFSRAGKFYFLLEYSFLLPLPLYE